MAYHEFWTLTSCILEHSMQIDKYSIFVPKLSIIELVPYLSVAFKHSVYGAPTLVLHYI